jgi:pimeloyl-ACP methyl ester carboxylesterase
MRTELVSIETDTTPLDGAFYWPEDRRVRGSVLLFHGNTMNFYVGAPRFLPPLLTDLGLVCLAFNRRGHDILSVRDSREAEGAAFQLTSEGIADNDYAASWMTGRGFSNPIVIGHSNGGMLGVAHVAHHPETPALVLLSAHRGGGLDLTRGAQRALAGEQFEQTMSSARELVAAGKGRQLMLVPGWWYVLSAESFVDRFTTMPDILELAPQIRCPVLYVRGDAEPKAAYPAEDFKTRAGGSCDVTIVPRCDHFYKGREAAVGAIVSDWLAGLSDGCKEIDMGRHGE